MTSIHHHLALQVADMERSVRFYLDTLDARVLTLPVSYEGEGAAEVMRGPAAYRHCLLGFDEGILELFEFAPEATPDWARDQHFRCVPHFGVVVEDVQATLAKIEAAGGQRIWPHPHVWETDPPTEII